MTSKILLPFLLSSILIACVCAKQKEPPKGPMLVNDFDIQYEPALPEELEGDENMDIQFDSQMANSAPKPNRRPNLKKVEEIFQREKGRLMAQVKAAGDRRLAFDNSTKVAFTHEFKYLNLNFWQRHVAKCCPYAHKYPFKHLRPYQCASSQFHMPCFYNYYPFVKRPEWCCPIWPTVYITRCECCQCAVLLSTCAHQGRCQRRYRMTSFLAICYSKKGWARIRYIRRYVSSSCYCRIG